jgi:putative DNA primase/helicase
MFMSVNVNLTHAADENRITVLSLRTLPKSDPAAFEASLQRIAETITPEYCAGFVARSVKLMPVIRDNAATFAKAVAAKLGSARIGDQIGTLLAGAYSLTCEDRITLEDARVWVEKQDWTDATAADAETDEQQLVNRLLLRRINVRSGVDRTVGELLRAAAGRDKEVSAAKAEDLLKQHGLMFRDRNIGKSEPYGMWVANRHTELENYLKDTPWATSWGRALKRYPGAQSSVSSLYFAGVYQRATFVPVVLPDD